MAQDECKQAAIELPQHATATSGSTATSPAGSTACLSTPCRRARIPQRRFISTTPHHNHLILHNHLPLIILSTHPIITTPIPPTITPHSHHAPFSSYQSAMLSLVLLFVLSLLSTTVTADTASISTSSCSTSGNVINNLKGIPRLNAKGTTISSDLGAYNWYTCTGANSTDCDWYNPFDGGIQVSQFYGSAPSSTLPVNVVQGYGVLIAFAIVMAVLSVLIGLSLCIGRYCCCCIRGGTCGKRWPTIKTRCCGIQPNLVTGQMEYSSRERWCARGYMWVFVIFTVMLDIDVRTWLVPAAYPAR